MWSYVDLEPDSLPPAGVLDADGLVFLGGSMSAYDDLPVLRTEISIIDQAVRKEIPLLGICLGAQLLAQTLGARVAPNPVPEIGWYPVSPTPAAAADPLLRHFANPEPLFQWHRDTFALPSGAVPLASSPDCANQAFRLGARTYGFQFHLEASPEVISEWLRADAACANREVSHSIDPFLHAARMETLSAHVFGAWLDLLSPASS